jgi:hypothetical protein
LLLLCAFAAWREKKEFPAKPQRRKGRVVDFPAAVLFLRRLTISRKIRRTIQNLQKGKVLNRAADFVELGPSSSADRPGRMSQFISASA